MEDSDCNGGRQEEEVQKMVMNIDGGNVVAVVDQDHQVVIEIESSVKEDNMSLVLANQVVVEQPSIEEKNKSLVVVVAASQEIVESSVEKGKKSLNVLANKKCNNNNTTAMAIDASMQNSSCLRNNNPNRQPEDHQLINDNVVVAHADSINWGKLLFEKKLTASDAGDYNRVVIPVKFAKQHFPPVDYTNPKHQVTITFYDIHNNEFKMKYESWPENQMNNLSKGWKHFLRFHNIHAYDMVQFYAGVDHHLHLARADAAKYVYGIHHYREPVISTKTLRFFGQYYIISEKRNNANHGGEVAIINEEHTAHFRPNGGRKRIRKATSARMTNHEQIEEYNQLLP
ncbi:hypothetical protein FRX31_005094 [Thalictrum thalictroides]|uniref:TF-B3 domain-containing protein n=1 Tax=Thalictrum thalictroides TaxID=46969 RepID=A0A7J6X6K1_THATH|nr:hypothetical protein FRX31_005094 [Thalictrum thalictroides]